MKDYTSKIVNDTKLFSLMNILNNNPQKTTLVDYLPTKMFEFTFDEEQMTFKLDITLWKPEISLDLVNDFASQLCALKREFDFRVTRTLVGTNIIYVFQTQADCVLFKMKFYHLYSTYFDQA